MVEEALALLGGVDHLIRPAATVVVKPNAGHPWPAEFSVNTSPEVVSAVVKAVRKANPKEIILAESAANGQDTLECLKISGVGKAAEDAGVDRIIDIKREKDLIRIPIRDAKSALKCAPLPRFLLEADHIINVPIFKSHVSMVFTCALKNIKGVVQDNVHREMHHTDLAAAMMDLWSIVKADLTIVDMIRPAEGYGPSHTLPTDFGCIVASKDPVAADATICRMIGLDLDRVNYFKAARDRGLGNYQEKSIQIRGRAIKEVFKRLWLPYLEGLEQWPEYDFYTDGACSSCMGLLGCTMAILKSQGKYDENRGISIVAGPKKKLPKGVSRENLILMGDCVRKYRNEGVFVQGCPPGEPHLMWGIVDRVNVDIQEEERRWAAGKGSWGTDRAAFREYQKKLKQKWLEESENHA
jgi:uncharacterized protein (DUF362 family)